VIEVGHTNFCNRLTGGEYCVSSRRWDRRGRDRMVVGFTTTHAISAYHH